VNLDMPMANPRDPDMLQHDSASKASNLPDGRPSLPCHAFTSLEPHWINAAIKRHLASCIDDRPRWLNADSGSDLDVMSLD